MISETCRKRKRQDRQQDDHDVAAKKHNLKFTGFVHFFWGFLLDMLYVYVLIANSTLTLLWLLIRLYFVLCLEYYFYMLDFALF